MPHNTFIAGTLSLLLSATALAAPINNETYFRAGLDAFNAGNYERALFNFQQAGANGMDTPALYYNLGVSHYKLGQFSRARAAFEATAKFPSMAALANYNLGLVEIKLNKPSQARHWFLLAKSVSTDPKLIALADYQISLLDQHQAETKEKKNDWLINADILLGYDDNVIDPDLLTESTESDGFTEFSGIISGSLAGSLKHGLRFDLDAYMLHYQRLSDYDANALQAGLAWVQPFGGGQIELGLSEEYSTLGSDAFLRGDHFMATWQSPYNKPSRLRLRYRASNFVALESVYGPLQGTRQQLTIDARRYFDMGMLRAEYMRESNARDDLKEAGTYTSYSPTRNGVRLLGSLVLPDQWRLESEAGYRLSIYNDPDMLADGTSLVREDDRYHGAIRLNRALGPRWQVELEYSHTQNDSNIINYDYRRNLISLGVMVFFF